MRKLSLIILTLFIWVTPAAADELAEVNALLKSKIDAVMVLLQDETIVTKVRDEKILALVKPLFDYKTMAKLSLGKKHWPTLNASEKKTFSELFVERVQQSYLDKLDIYTDEEIIYETSQASGKKIYVPTTLISKDNRISVLYKFYRSRAGWKIYDVEIGGVSVIQTYRSQFDDVLREGSVEVLLEKLKTDDAFTIPAPETSGT
jgi:phospholipid transport system substrate-binding protein